MHKLKKQFPSKFVMKDLEATNQILGMRITKNKVAGTLTLLQGQYIRKIQEKFSM